MFREQCSLLSHEGWALRWDPRMKHTPHVRGQSITPEVLKFIPKVSCFPPYGPTKEPLNRNRRKRAFGG